MVAIKALKREIFGKAVSVLRKNGLVPAELYGRGFPNVHLTVPVRDFTKAFKEAGESAVLKLNIEGEQAGDYNVLIHEVSKNPLTDEITHVDFYQVRMDEKVKTSVPLRFVGEAPAVKEFDGILVKAMQEVEVEALPGNLPSHLEVDLSKIKEIGGSIYVQDLKIPAGVEIQVEPETVIATVTEKAKEEEVVAGPVSVEEVKVEGEEKKKDKEKEAEDGKEKGENAKREK